jgi:integrase
VQKDSATDTNWYIIPLCVKHSIKAECLEIADTTTFASAHVGESCAKLLPIGNVWPHELRATLATNALRHGADSGQVQDWIDHAISAPIRLYAKRKERPAEHPALRGMY